MLKFFIINDFNDINDAIIRHFSLDKGHFIAKSLSKLGHEVFFLTNKNDYTINGIKYISMKNVNQDFIGGIDYIMIIREPLILNILATFPAIKEKMAIPNKNRKNPKFIIKSDCPLWFRNRTFATSISRMFFLKNNRADVGQWVSEHIDFICAQNEDFAKLLGRYKIPKTSIIITNMSIVNESIDYDKLVNPYDKNHSYCVNNAAILKQGKALWPLYYLSNPEKINELNIDKYIIVYTGRIKTNNGRILFNMRNIMNLLGEKYELHIFPGGFVIPAENNITFTKHSGKNARSLEILRNGIFRDTKNVIIHYPYEHEDKYRYLYYANCGIDFSDVRPHHIKGLAGHAKILEYCESGLPVVCEENIHNLFLVRNGKNGIILPYLASDEQYAEAIKKIVTMPIDRQFCREITVKNENWDKRVADLLLQVKINQ